VWEAKAERGGGERPGKRKVQSRKRWLSKKRYKILLDQARGNRAGKKKA